MYVYNKGLIMNLVRITCNKSVHIHLVVSYLQYNYIIAMYNYHNKADLLIVVLSGNKECYQYYHMK